MTNRTDKTLWVPSSHGECLGCEAVNFKIGGKGGPHYDYGRCIFPDQYIQLKPKDSRQYVHRLPQDAKGTIEISIWAPWRTKDGQRIDAKAKQAALKADEVLIEEIAGAGRLNE